MNSINSSIIFNEWKLIKSSPVSAITYNLLSAFIKKLHLYSGLTLEEKSKIHTQGTNLNQHGHHRTNSGSVPLQSHANQIQTDSGTYNESHLKNTSQSQMNPHNQQALNVGSGVKPSPTHSGSVKEMDLGGSFAYQSICMDIFTFLSTFMVNHLSQNFTFLHILSLLEELTRGCKDIWCTETNFLNFVIAVLQNSKDSVEICNYSISLIHKYVHEQRLSFDQEEVALLIETISQFLLTMRLSGDDISEIYLPIISKLFAIPTLLHRYNLLPQNVLVALCGTVCQTVYYPSLTKYAILLTFALLQDPIIGKRTFQTILDIMNLSPYQSFFRGAVYFVGMASWGTERIEQLQVAYVVVLRAMLRVLISNDPLVTYEVVLNIKRLVRKYGKDLSLEWDIITQIVEKVKKQKFNSSTKDKSSEIRLVLHDIILEIIKLQRNNGYYGDESKLITILEGFTEDEIVKFVLEFHKKILHPAHQDWIKEWNYLLSNYLNNDQVSDLMRCKVFELFKHQLFEFAALSSEELLSAGIPSFMIVLKSESTSKELRKNLLILLKEISSEIRLTSRTFEEVIGLIASTMQNCTNDSDNQVFSASLLSDLLKEKFDKLPCSEAPIIFSHLVSALSHNNSQVRKKSLDILLTLRADPMFLLEINGIKSPYLLCCSTVEPRKLVYVLSISVCIEEILSRVILEEDEILQFTLKGLNDLILNNYLLKEFPSRRIARAITEKLRKTIDKSIHDNEKTFVNCQILLRSISGYGSHLDENVLNDIFSTLIASLTSASKDSQFLIDCIVECLKTLIIFIHEVPKQLFDNVKILFQCLQSIEEKLTDTSSTPVMSNMFSLLLHFVAAAPHKLLAELINQTFHLCLKYCNQNAHPFVRQLAQQVMMSWFIHCPFSLRQALVKDAMKILYTDMKETQNWHSEAAIDFLLRYTFLSCEQSFEMNDQLANMFNNQKYKAWYLGNGILTAQVGKFGNVLLRYRRPTGTIAWTMKLVNSTHKSSLKDEQYEDIPEYFNQFPVGASGFPDTEHAAASIIASNISLSTKMSISPLYQDSMGISISETDLGKYEDSSFYSDSESPNNSYFDPVISSYDEEIEPSKDFTPIKSTLENLNNNLYTTEEKITKDPEVINSNINNINQVLSEDWGPLSMNTEELLFDETPIAPSLELNEDDTKDETHLDESNKDENFQVDSINLGFNSKLETPTTNSKEYIDDIPISKSAKVRFEGRLDQTRNRSLSTPIRDEKVKDISREVRFKNQDDEVIESKSSQLKRSLQKATKLSSRLRSYSMKSESPTIQPRSQIFDMAHPISNRFTIKDHTLSQEYRIYQKENDIDSTILHPNFPYLFLRNWTFFSNEPPRGLKSSVQLTRTLAMFDFVSPLENIKVGVIYRAEKQVNQQEILTNTYGSPRYFEFLKGLGKFEPLHGMNAMFSGGLDTSDEKLDGEHTINYRDEINHITYHVGTLMPNSIYDENCSNKLKHIGNDYVVIVYSDNLDDYSINTLSGEFCVIQLIIYPLGDELNRIQVKIKDNWKDELLFNSLICENHMISDKSLPLYIRSLCIQADMVTQEKRSLMGQYVSNWQHRLKQINNIKNRFSSEFNSSEEFESSMKDLFDE